MSKKEDWIPVSKRLPENNSELHPTELEVIGFNKNWIDPDFNPNGTRICSYVDDAWLCYKWIDTNDEWATLSEEFNKDASPTYWQPLPEPPTN